jgi:hypothetical protein
MESLMAKTKDAKQKQSGEKSEGKYHYNPGNMAGKTIESDKDEPEQENNVDRARSRTERPHER